MQKCLDMQKKKKGQKMRLIREGAVSNRGNCDKTSVRGDKTDWEITSQELDGDSLVYTS